jgi:hypothetical protein
MIEAIQPDDAVQPLTGMTNRWQKRRYEQEALRVVNHLEEINTSFLYEIFDEDNSQDYSVLYEYWLKRWTAKVQVLCDQSKIKFIGIDSHWFERNYRPSRRDEQGTD